MVGDLVLVDEDLVGALEWRRHDEAAALVVERRQDDRGCRGLFDALKLRPLGSGAASHADHGSGLGH